MNDLNNYHMNNSNINIKILKIVDKIKTDSFLKNYKISNFLKGKFFIKKLINRVFKYNLKLSMSWNKSFWKITNIHVVDISVSYGNKFRRLNDFEIYVNKDLTKRSKTKRLKDIYKYMELIKENNNLSYPLYITGTCINELAGNVNDNELFLLDGTRRIIANILLEKKIIKAYMISKSEEFEKLTQKY